MSFIMTQVTGIESPFFSPHHGGKKFTKKTPIFKEMHISPKKPHFFKKGRKLGIFHEDENGAQTGGILIFSRISVCLFVCL